MKRILAFLLVLVMLFSMAGCSDLVDEVKDEVKDKIIEALEEEEEPEDEPKEEPEETEPEETEPEETEPEETEPAASETVVYDSFYYFYDYLTEEYIYSDVAAFHAVTGTACTASSLDFGFLEEEDYEYMTEGYDERYAVFLYPYDSGALEAYITYLESVGYAYLSSEDFNEGTSYYYQNGENGYLFDVFVMKNAEGVYEYVALEPCVNKLDSTEDYYDFYDYANQEYLDSDLISYHGVTGATCTASALDFGFLSEEGYEDIVEGYDPRYAVFLYEYDQEQLEYYFSYLEANGYALVTTMEYNEGMSYYYQDPSNGYTLDIFLLKSDFLGYENVVIEPYLNGDTP